MKKGLLLIVILTLSAVVFHSCKSESQFKVGTSVAAKWADNNYYLATISAISGDKYTVNYADGTSGDAVLTDLKLFTDKEDLKVGDKVIAVWAGAKLYSAKIKELKPTGAMVTWDDGSADSEVAFGKILKIE
jgi:hypothetical protein